MTVPHLMNCPHTDSGWCTECVAALGNENWELRADANRYRWLRDRHPADEGLWVAMGKPYTPPGVSCWRNDELDAAIDAAMTAALAVG